MRSRLALVSLFAFATLALGAGRARAVDPPPTVDRIGERVMCLCGCVAILNHCPHQNCSMHEEMRATIQKAIAEGKDENAILQLLVQQYGVKVLAAPPAQGFDLAAWLLPGLGLAVGLALVVMIVRRWRKPGEIPATAAGGHDVDPKLLAAVEEEMKTSGMGIRK
ncbi:MAG: cytochrome c-type biogenesis protein CcmH [Acidobacteriia bacterium]|nr:cytochrome c-type biogenesis protein CcmH [Terriglobia bacterium]